MHQLLKHRASQSMGLESVHVGCEVQEEAVLISYELRGDLQALQLPPYSTSHRSTQVLWKSTCFDVFIQQGGSPGYRQFNFAPSGAWAVQDFTRYRQEQGPPVLDAHLHVDQQRGPTCFVQTVHIPPEFLPHHPRRLGLCVTVEDRRGHLAYWALHHPASRPDFHDRDSFVLPWPPT